MMDVAAVVFVLSAVLYGGCPLLNRYPRTAKAGFILTPFLPIAAGIVLGISAILARGMRGTPDAVAWAQDAYRLSLRVGGIFTAVVGGSCLLAALTDHRLRRTRMVVGVAGAWMLLAVGYAYGVICVGKAVNPSPYVWMASLGYSGLMMTGAIVDAVRGKKRGKSRRKP